MKYAASFGVAMASLCASLCCAQSAEVQGLGYRFLPKSCLELTIDAFEQLRSRRERVCTLTEEIHSLRAVPSASPSQAMQFQSGPDWIEVRGYSAQLGKQIPFFRIEARGLELFCAVLTVPRQDVENALKEFRTWLANGVFEYTTKGGQNVRLTPTIPLETLTLGVGRAGGAAAEIKTEPCEPADVEIMVRPIEQSTWTETASAPGEVVGLLGGVEMSLVVESGVCKLQQADAPFEEYKRELEKLRQMKSLEPYLTVAQRKIYAYQLDPQERRVRALQAKVTAAHGDGIAGSWLLVLRDIRSGHLYATAILRGGKD